MTRHVMTVIVLVVFGALSSARGQYLEATIPVGDSPYNLMWSPIGNKVYVANTQDGTVSVIDGATNAVIATIPVEDYPDMFALNTVNGKVYCPSGSEDRLNVICAYGDTLIRKVRLTGYPLFPVYNQRRNKLYVSGVDNDGVYVLDGQTDEVIEVLSIRRPQWPCLQLGTDRLLVKSNLDSDTIVVIDCSADTVTARQPQVRGIESTPRVGLNGMVYVPCESLVEVYSPDGEEHIASIDMPIYTPLSSAYCPFAAKFYVGDFGAAGVVVVDCVSNTVVRIVGPGAQVRDLLCDTITGKLYVLGSSAVRVFDTRSDSLMATAQLPTYSESVTWNPVNRRLYASAPVANVVYVVRDTTTGVSEEAEVAIARRAVSRIVRGVLDLSASGVWHQASSVLLDAAGRKAADLRPGPNDVSWLSPGIYFVREPGTVRTRRVVLLR